MLYENMARFLVYQSAVSAVSAVSAIDIVRRGRSQLKETLSLSKIICFPVSSERITPLNQVGRTKSRSLAILGTKIFILTKLSVALG